MLKSGMDTARYVCVGCSDGGIRLLTLLQNVANRKSRSNKYLKTQNYTEIPSNFRRRSGNFYKFLEVLGEFPSRYRLYFTPFDQRQVSAENVRK